MWLLRAFGGRFIPWLQGAMLALLIGVRLPAGGRTPTGLCSSQCPHMPSSGAFHLPGAGCPLAAETLRWQCAAHFPCLAGHALVLFCRRLPVACASLVACPLLGCQKICRQPGKEPKNL